VVLLRSVAAPLGPPEWAVTGNRRGQMSGTPIAVMPAIGLRSFRAARAPT